MSIDENIDPVEAALRQKYSEETGKTAMWRGKLSNPYLNWKKQQLVKSIDEVEVAEEELAEENLVNDIKPVAKTVKPKSEPKTVKPKSEPKTVKPKSEPKTIKPKTIKPKPENQPDPADNPVWQFFKPFLPKIGKWSWIILMIVGSIFLILDLLIADIFGIISNIIIIVFTILWVKPVFSPALMEERYEDLLNETFNISTIRIPKMLAFGVLFEIFGDGWVGIIILIPAIVLIFFSAYIPYNWNVKKNE